MKTKICYECGVEKPLIEFYKHPETKDGYAGKCKECAKQYVIATYKKRKINPGMIEIMRMREVEKRNGFQDKSYRDLFPEKIKANASASRLKVSKGMCKHHWSYLKVHWKDIIELTKSNHKKIHAYTKYDQERMQYRTLSGILLDTKDKYIRYMDKILIDYDDNILI